MLHNLAQAEERNQTLMHQVSAHAERCHQLEEQLKRSEEITDNLQAKVSPYKGDRVGLYRKRWGLKHERVGFEGRGKALNKGCGFIRNGGAFNEVELQRKGARH